MAGENSLKVGGKNGLNCPKGDFLFCAVVGQGVKNEEASTRKEEVYEYKVTLEVDEDKAVDFMDGIDDFMEDNLSKGDEVIKVPYQTHDDYDGIPKGKVWISAKCRTKYEDRDGEEQDATVNIYDKDGNKCTLPEGVGVGKGSTGKILGTITVWDKKEGVGSTLWLSGVQIGDFTPYEFEEAPEEMEGSFKGFDKKEPELEKETDDNEADEKPARRSRRNRSSNADDEKTARRSRRRRG